MAESSYEVLLSGELAPGVDRVDATNALAALMKLPVARVVELMSQGPVSVKRDVDAATAQRYKARIEQTGMLCVVRPPIDSPPPDALELDPRPPGDLGPKSPQRAVSQPAASAPPSPARARTAADEARASPLSGYLPEDDQSSARGRQPLPEVVEAGRVSVGRGLGWISGGFRVFRQSPWVWIGITVIYAVAFTAVAAVPLVGALAIYLLQPVLFGGVMLGCDALRRGEQLDVSHLFKGFDRDTGRLIGLGGVYLGAMVATFVLSAILFFILAGMSVPVADLISAAESGNQPPAHVVEPLIFAVPVAILVGLTATFVIVALLWFSPALVVLRSVDVGEALKLSLVGCLKNWLPFLIYGLAFIVLGLLASLPLMLGWLVLGPVMVGSIYTAYREIYPDADAVDGYLGQP